MYKCIYYDTLNHYGCPELTVVFCNADDVMYDKMHPNLYWKRTKTIGEGGAICEFRIWLESEKK